MFAIFLPNTALVLANECDCVWPSLLLLWALFVGLVRTSSVIVCVFAQSFVGRLSDIIGIGIGLGVN